MSSLCVFGDSITWGSWDPEGGGWVNRLRTLGCQELHDPDNPGDPYDYLAVYNCGINGNRVADVHRRIEAEAKARNAGVILLAAGINDVPHNTYPGTPEATFRKAYRALIRKSQALAGEVLALTPTNVCDTRNTDGYRNADIATIVRYIKDDASEYGVPLVDLFGILEPNDLDPDGLHPVASGHEKIFRAVLPVVLALPSLRKKLQ